MSLKRKATVHLDRDNFKQQLEKSFGKDKRETFGCASPEENASRRIRRGKRRLPQSSDLSKVEINFDIPNTDPSSLLPKQTWDSFKIPTVPQLPTIHTDPLSLVASSSPKLEIGSSTEATTSPISSTISSDGSVEKNENTVKIIENTDQERMQKEEAKEAVHESHSPADLCKTGATETKAIPSSSSCFSNFTFLKNPFSEFSSSNIFGTSKFGSLSSTDIFGFSSFSALFFEFSQNLYRKQCISNKDRNQTRF